MKIDCLNLRDKIASKIKTEVGVLKKRGIVPSFAIIQVGDYPPSDAYVRVKMKKARELGINAKIFNFKFLILNEIQKNKIQNEIIKLIGRLNHDNNIHGIITQRPLPPDFDAEKLQSFIDPQKDIDGLSPNSAFPPPVALAVNEVLSYIFSNFEFRISNLRPVMVVVGKGRTAGKPIFEYFSSRPVIPAPALPRGRQAGIQISLPITQIDSQTSNPDEILKDADMIISCVGKPQIVRRDNVKKGVVLISVGQRVEQVQSSKCKVQNDNLKFKINSLFKNLKLGTRNLRKSNGKTKWVGDYDEENIKDCARAYTPTPCGIGPLNVIFLLKNVVQAATSAKLPSANT